MEPRILTAAALVELTSAVFNEFQDESLGMREGDTNNDYTSGGGFTRGIAARIWSYVAIGGLATGAEPVVVDQSIDWRDRHILAAYISVGGVTRAAGDTDDYLLSGFSPTISFGYTGLGGLTAGSADPSVGNPPSLSLGRYLVTLTTNVSLYASTVDGSLKLYNNTGATIYPVIFLLASGETGMR